MKNALEETQTLRAGGWP